MAGIPIYDDCYYNLRQNRGTGAKKAGLHVLSIRMVQISIHIICYFSLMLKRVIIGALTLHDFFF